MNTPTPRHPDFADTPSDETLKGWLSELADGQADERAAQGACQAWREQPEMRRTWHSYQLIGDVLRSEELARPAAGDLAFLAGVRARLAQEPVVLAPAPLQQPAPVPMPVAAVARRQRWLAPAAAAAGFLAVAGVLVVTRLAAPEGSAGQPLQARTAPAVAPSSGLMLANTGGVAAAQPGGTGMLRDARLDAYISAHQAARGGGAAAVPGAGLRSVEVVVPAAAPAASAR